MRSRKQNCKPSCSVIVAERDAVRVEGGLAWIPHKQLPVCGCCAHSVSRERPEFRKYTSFYYHCEAFGPRTVEDRDDLMRSGLEDYARLGYLRVRLGSGYAVPNVKRPLARMSGPMSCLFMMCSSKGVQASYGLLQ